MAASRKKFNLEEAIFLYNNKFIDTSEYLLLLLPLLQQVTTKDQTYHDHILHLQKLYLEGDYDNILAELANFSKKENPFNELLTNEFSEIINEFQDQPVPPLMISAEKNYARRYFETHFANSQEMHINHLNNLITFFNGGIINNDDEAADKFNSFIESLKIAEVTKLIETLTETIFKEHFMRKDRAYKVGFSQGNNTETTHSHNAGVMTANQPNFYDELSEQVLKNRVVDRSHISKYKPQGYSSSHPHIPFIASISGHALYVTALLIQYITEKKMFDNNLNDPTSDAFKAFESEINNIIKDFVISNIQLGYHSYIEMMDIFNNPELKQLFNDYNIKIDTSWDADLLHTAFTKAQEYTQELVGKRLQQAELRHHQPEHTFESSDEIKILYYALDKKIQDIIRQHNGSDKPNPKGTFFNLPAPNSDSTKDLLRELIIIKNATDMSYEDKISKIDNLLTETMAKIAEPTQLKLAKAFQECQDWLHDKQNIPRQTYS